MKSPIKSFREFDFGHVIAETITAVVTRSEGQFWNFPEFSADEIKIILSRKFDEISNYV